MPAAVSETEGGFPRSFPAGQSDRYEAKRLLDSGYPLQARVTNRMPLTFEAEISPGMAPREVVSLAQIAEDGGFDRLGISCI